MRFKLFLLLASYVILAQAWFQLKRSGRMYAFWVLWALIVGGITIICSDDWNARIKGEAVRGFLAFMFAGIAMPIISTLAWPPIRDDLWLPHRILGAYACTAAFGFGFFVALAGRKFIRKRVAST
jgi:hypothetical protein